MLVHDGPTRSCAGELSSKPAGGRSQPAACFGERTHPREIRQRISASRYGDRRRCVAAARRLRRVRRTARDVARPHPVHPARRGGARAGRGTRHARTETTGGSDGQAPGCMLAGARRRAAQATHPQVDRPTRERRNALSHRRTRVRRACFTPRTGSRHLHGSVDCRSRLGRCLGQRHSSATAS